MPQIKVRHMATTRREWSSCSGGCRLGRELESGWENLMSKEFAAVLAESSMGDDGVARVRWYRIVLWH